MEIFLKSNEFYFQPDILYIYIAIDNYFYRLSRYKLIKSVMNNFGEDRKYIIEHYLRLK